MAARDLFDTCREDARAWARGRSWIWRAPLLAYLGVAGLRHVASEEYASFLFGGITFGIHELGHVIFAALGEWMGIAGGSLAQVLAPIAAGAVLLLYRQDGEPQRDWFGVSVAGCWLSFSLYNLATYVGDARAQELPLLGLSDDPEHDWAYLLSSVGLLELDGALAAITRVLAFAIWAASLGLGAWLLLTMHRTRGEPRRAGSWRA